MSETCRTEKAETRFSNASIAGESLRPKQLSEIMRELQSATGDWPRRLAGVLFVPTETGEPYFLDKPEDLFGWLGTTFGTVRWHNLPGCTSKSELHAALRRLAFSYETSELYPHEPRIEGVYYTNREEVLPGDGKALAEFLSFFRPATDLDGKLIEAMLMTLLWGGMGGRRPVFVITSEDGPGTGKSTLARLSAEIFGGGIEVTRKDDINAVKARLLSGDAVNRRVVILDNVRETRFSWGELEALVTSPTISGWRLYKGEGRKPNLFTWIVTLNGLCMTADLAQRSVVIRLKKGEFQGAFEDRVWNFVETHRERIIADLVAALRREKSPIEAYSRWASWEEAVLSHVGMNFGAVQKEVLNRQAGADDDAEEAELLDEVVYQRLCQSGFDPNSEVVRIGIRHICEWAETAWKTKMPTQAISRKIRQFIQHGNLPHLLVDKSHTFGRCLVWSMTGSFEKPKLFTGDIAAGLKDGGPSC